MTTATLPASAKPVGACTFTCATCGATAEGPYHFSSPPGWWKAFQESQAVTDRYCSKACMVAALGRAETCEQVPVASGPVVTYHQTATQTFYHGDVLSVLRTLPADSVHCCVTSPPYWALRDYGVTGQLGLEPTPEAYVTAMVAVFREVRRVLRPDGTLWLNIGDSYAGSWGNYGGQGRGQGGQRPINGGSLIDNPAHHGTECTRPATSNNIPGIKAKDLVGIPWMLAFALRADGWYLRSDIIWSKPNPMPESVTDRPTKAHEYLFLLTKSARYYYDADAIREPHSPDGRKDTLAPLGDKGKVHYGGADGHERWPNGGRNKRSVWEIATESFDGAHFATYPQALVEPCIKAGTSERGVCPTCGAPWVRVVEKETASHEATSATSYDTKSSTAGRLALARQAARAKGGEYQNASTTTGWAPTCTHEAEPVPGTVLDPFLGSGTTAWVATRLGRKAIGIDLNAEYLALAVERNRQQALL